MGRLPWKNFIIILGIADTCNNLEICSSSVMCGVSLVEVPDNYDVLGTRYLVPDHFGTHVGSKLCSFGNLWEPLGITFDKGF